MIVREIQAKSVLSTSKIYDYAVNPYGGCQHACSYCYARFMKRFTGHREPWGEYVDVKINAPEVLERELARKKPGRVWVSGVCDAYQPLERRYRLTRECLRLLVESRWPVVVQTRSPLVVRDLDILQRGDDLEVGITVTTADDQVRKWFEPGAPPIRRRLQALGDLHDAGVRTFAMIAPLLPGAEALGESLPGRVDRVLIDRMNYGYGSWVYRKYELEYAQSPEFFRDTARALAAKLEAAGIPCQILF